MPTAKDNSRSLESGTSRLWPRYLISAFFGLLLLALLHWILSPPPAKSLHWTLRLAVAAAGLLGLVFSWIGAWRAHSADRRTNELLSRLEETNKIVRRSPTSYAEVFDYHLLRPLKRAAEARPDESKTHYMNLLLSTPAYGYHVLGLQHHKEFQKGLQRTQCNKQIIVFSPDAHFFHVANTILWHPLRAVLPFKNRDPKVEPLELAICISDTIEILEHQVKWSQEGPHVGVWITDQALFRLTSFEFGEDSYAYVLLTDAVTLVSDLHRFTGRLLAVPDTLYRHLIGFHNDPEAFIEKIKWCPYSLRSGDEASLRPEELEWLRYDYLLLRTEQVLFDLTCFDSQCRRLITLAWQARKDLSDEQKLLQGAKAILDSTVGYFSRLSTDCTELSWVAPTTGRQERKLALIPRISNIAGNTEKPVDVRGREIGSLLQETTRDETWFVQHLGDYLATSERGDDPASHWISAVFYLLTSGFRESELAARRQRGLFPPAAPTEEALHSAATSVTPAAPVESPPRGEPA